MSRAFLAAITIVIAGCGSSPTAISLPKHSPPGTASPTASDGTALISSAPGSSAAATAAATPVMSCKLPVVLDSEAGWVTFPGGSYRRDSKADQLPHGSALPLAKSYDKSFDRWVPVSRDSISPDGQHYAYAETAGHTIHVVDLGSGANHVFSPAPPHSDSVWTVIDYETEGVYFEEQPNGIAPPVGLWLLTVSTGAVRWIEATKSWQYISGGGAWTTSEALTGHGPGLGSRLLRLDLRSEAIASWYKRNDIEFTVAGADAAGHPVLQVWKDTAPQILVISAQDSASALPLATGSAVPALNNISHPVSDAHGMWFGDTNGSLSLYTPATGIKKLAQVGSGDVGLGGGCH